MAADLPGGRPPAGIGENAIIGYLRLMDAVQRCIELEYVDPLLTKCAPGAIDCRRDEGTDIVLADGACLGNPWHLQQGIREADMRDEAAG